MARTLATLILAAVLLALPGCGLTFRATNTPEAQQAAAVTAYGTTQDAFTAAVEVLTTLKREGRIDQQTWDVNVLPAVNSGDKALDEWEVAISRGEYNPPARAILETLVRYLTAEAERARSRRP